MKKFLIFAATALLFMQSGLAQSLNIYCEDSAKFISPEGRITSLDVEIVTEIQKRVGNTDPIQFVPWTRGLKSLETETNAILFSMARSKERNDLYQWIGPIADSVYGFYAKADSTVVINNLDDARKVASIGVYRNDIRDQFLTREGFANLDRTSNNLSNLKKLMVGRVVVIASTAMAIKSEAKRAGYNLKDVKFLYPFLKLPIYIAASKTTDPKIVASWNAALDSMKKDGTLKKIFENFMSDADLPGSESPVF